MSKKSVFCIATSRGQADRIVDQLRIANFSSNDISVLFPDKDTTRDFAHEKNTKAPEGIATGAGTGGVVGGALGWIAGIGALAIPGVGPFIAAGPIMAALSGAAVGAAVGGIAGGLIGLGIPELEAKPLRREDQAGQPSDLGSYGELGRNHPGQGDFHESRSGRTFVLTGEESLPKDIKVSDITTLSDKGLAGTRP